LSENLKREKRREGEKANAKYMENKFVETQGI
jgi:hypothetical protein